jgi:LPXTG-motif cell wall-anchored protein
MSKTVRLFALLFSFAFVCVVVSPKSYADQWDKKTILTFSGPVVVAGHRLEAGTYVFKLADTVDRHIVQIFNEDENHVYATILAIPTDRLEPADKTVIKFSETTDGSTTSGTLAEEGVPIKKWFYPGETVGEEFPVKPAPVMAEVATAEPTTPPPAEAQPAPQPEEQPAEVTPPAETETQPQAQEAAPAPAPTESTPAEPAPAETPTTLPKTASSMPLLGLIGLLSLAAAGSLRLVSRRRG